MNSILPHTHGDGAHDFEESDIELSDGAQLSGVEGSGAAYTATITLGAGMETTTVRVPQNVAQSMDDNSNNRASDPHTVRVTAQNSDGAIRYTLAAFGREVALSAMDVLGERFMTPPPAGANGFVLGGQSLSRSVPAESMAYHEPDASANQNAGRDMSGRELLSRSSFHYALNGNNASAWSLRRRGG